jgi:hypothetical protein
LNSKIFLPVAGVQFAAFACKVPVLLLPPDFEGSFHALTEVKTKTKKEKLHI